MNIISRNQSNYTIYLIILELYFQKFNFNKNFNIKINERFN